ncbi:MAG: hypothetical protein LBT85_02415 [Bifidobacteriaceae bacterium]|nr:hypothetical protein [Bifidobacteriaceae bacterium]
MPKRAVKKFGILGIVFLFGVSAFISGYNINSYAASSSAVTSPAPTDTLIPTPQTDNCST